MEQQALGNRNVRRRDFLAFSAAALALYYGANIW